MASCLQTTRSGSFAALRGAALCSLHFVCAGLLLAASVDGSLVPAGGCSLIYGPAAGWAVDSCPTDESIPVPMAVVLDGVPQTPAALVRVYHVTDDGSSLPQIAVFYASGYVRLKQNADPDPPIPFGSSFILGPGYWPVAGGYHPNPTLAQLAIDTSWLPRGPLRLLAVGANHDFDVVYRMALPPPHDEQTRLHVEQRYTANAAVTIDPARIAAAEGFKLVQVSSMYIDEGGSCDAGSDCHDSNAARCVGDDLARREAPFADVPPDAFVFPTLEPLGTTWLDALHTDDESWQGNTPNVRVALDGLPDGGATVTPQGWIAATSDPNQDNVALWLHDDDPAAHGWNPGESAELGYWLIAQDDPFDPWADRALRDGVALLDMEGSENCFFVHDPGQGTSGAVGPIAGYRDRALDLDYDLGFGDGHWAQIRCDFDPPLDLSPMDHLRFEWRGAAAAANSLQVSLANHVAGVDRYFGADYRPGGANHAWWGQMRLPFRFLSPWTPGTTLDPSAVTAFFVSVVSRIDPNDNDPDDVGGIGRLAFDELGAWNVANRAIPDHAEPVAPHAAAEAAALDWLASQQRASGLLKSWLEEPEAPDCLAHTYDQALALLAFSDAVRWTEADALVAALSLTQNPDGSWFETFECGGQPLSDNPWEGAVAWVVLALDRYLESGGAHPQAAAMRDAAADWLTTLLDAEECPLRDHTEAAIDLWWALSSATPAHACAAHGVKRCLLEDYWDPVMGRFKGGRDTWKPFLDNQTWGAAFLRANGRPRDALRALSFAGETLRLPSQGAELEGFDGQGGPWSVWTEGIGQYAAAGGPGSTRLAEELLAQLAVTPEGAVPGSPDDFSGGGVWTTRWHGVAPTAWAYFALTGGPFPPPTAVVFADGFECGSTTAWSNTVP